jgi:hypothetical protein
VSEIRVGAEDLPDGEPGAEHLPDGGPAAQEATPERLRYRVLTGPDDRTFCERVSAALAEGYQLHGGPALTFDGERVIVAQALVLGGPGRSVLEV